MNILIRIARLSLGQSVEKVDPATGVSKTEIPFIRYLVKLKSSEFRLIR